MTNSRIQNFIVAPLYLLDSHHCRLLCPLLISASGCSLSKALWKVGSIRLPLSQYYSHFKAFSLSALSVMRAGPAVMLDKCLKLCECFIVTIIFCVIHLYCVVLVLYCVVLVFYFYCFVLYCLYCVALLY